MVWVRILDASHRCRISPLITSGFRWFKTTHPSVKSTNSSSTWFLMHPSSFILQPPSWSSSSLIILHHPSSFIIILHDLHLYSIHISIQSTNHFCITFQQKPTARVFHTQTPSQTARSLNCLVVVILLKSWWWAFSRLGWSVDAVANTLFQFHHDSWPIYEPIGSVSMVHLYTYI